MTLALKPSRRAVFVDGQVDPRHPAFVKSAFGATAVLAGATFLGSMPATIAAGEWAHLGHLAYVVPFAYEGGYVALSLIELRIVEVGVSGKLAKRFSIGLGISSAALQVLHVLSLDLASGDFGIHTIAGAFVGASLPIIQMVATKSLVSAFVLRRKHDPVKQHEVRQAAMDEAERIRLEQVELDRRAHEQTQSERERELRRDRVKLIIQDNPDAVSKSGSEERELFVAEVIESLDEGQSKQDVARELGVQYHQVRAAERGVPSFTD